MTLKRTGPIDHLVILGWIAIVVTGQCLLNAQIKGLEWFAVTWLVVGMLVVRKTSCLPLLILTCPAYMCETQRTMAWTQVMVAAVFAGRVLLEGPLSRRQRLTILFCGSLVLFLSWPAQPGSLFADLTTSPPREWLDQYLHARATWSVYPFRQAADRTLMAMLIAAIVLSGQYFSSRRVWRAFCVCGLLMLLASFCAALVPWHKPHLFLGTTNHASWSTWAFSGAGYNVIFLTLPLMTLIPSLILPVFSKKRWLWWGLTGLLLPVPYANQRILAGALAGLMVVLLVFFVRTMAGPAKRSKLIRRFRPTKGACSAMALTFALCGGLSLAWGLKMNVLHLPDARPKAQTTVKRTVNKPTQPATARPAPCQSDGTDLWYGNSSVLQGSITFCTNAGPWSSLRAGTLITIAENDRIESEDGRFSVEGSKAFGTRWIHVSTAAENRAPSPLARTLSNIQGARPGRFLVGGTGWEMTITDRSGEPVFGPIGDRIRGWKSVRVGDKEVGCLQTAPASAAIGDYEDGKSSTFGQANTWNGGSNCQDLVALESGGVTGSIPGLVINEFSAVGTHCTLAGGDSRLGRIPGNGGYWIELVVTKDALDIRGWTLMWAVTGSNALKYAWAGEDQKKLDSRLKNDDSWPGRIRRWSKRLDRSRYYMWRLGAKEIADHYIWTGAGAGTWGRFHRSIEAPIEWRKVPNVKASKVRMKSHPHMHNTYLDLVFEYGLIPMLIVYLLGSAAFIAIAAVRRGPSSLWLLYLAPVALFALVQNVLYAFTQMVILAPLLVVLLMGLRVVLRRSPGPGRKGLH
jgi:hypothetical protein